MSDITPSTGDFLKQLGAAVSKNPAPAALVGMGLIWLFTSKGSQYRIAAESLGFVEQRAAGAAKSVGQSVEGQSRTQGVFDPLGANYLSAMSSELSDLIQRQPLLLGAIGVAIGAGVAASLPISEIETDLLGDASAGIQDKARSLAVEESRQASSLAKNVTTAVEHEVRNQGLASENVKGVMSETREKLKNVIHAGVESAREHLN